MNATKNKNRKAIRTSLRTIDSLDFQMMPEDGGQIVEVMYACDEDGVWCRTHDRSDRSTSYQFAAYHARATEDQLSFEPQNSKLPKHNKWQDVVVA